MKTISLILKLLGLILSGLSFMFLMATDTISDKWFSEWLQGTIASAAFTIFFAAWLGETIINWNKTNTK